MGKLRVVIPEGGESPAHGVCYVGMPDRHMILGPDLRLHLIADGFYCSHSIDALFSSLARNAGKRTIGVVLSGMLKDGTLGLRSIKEAGGIALVQSPKEAEYREMPESAIRHDGHIDLVGPIDVLASETCKRTGYLPEPVEPV